MENKKISLDCELALIALCTGWYHYRHIERAEEDPILHGKFETARMAVENSIKAICGILDIKCRIEDDTIRIDGIDRTNNIHAEARDD